MIKDFTSKTPFSGSYEEDLENNISLFNTPAMMWELKEEDKLKSVPTMPTGDALNYLSSNSSPCKSFEDDMQVLKDLYNSDDIESRI